MYHLTKFFCLNEPIYVLKNVLRKTEFTKLYQFNIHIQVLQLGKQ